MSMEMKRLRAVLRTALRFSSNRHRAAERNAEQMATLEKRPVVCMIVAHSISGRAKAA
jgi:hypothetical protein